MLVIAARKTWVGYISDPKGLPKLREGVLASNGEVRTAAPTLPAESLRMIDFWYACDYRPFQDVNTILKNYRSLAG